MSADAAVLIDIDIDVDDVDIYDPERYVAGPQHDVFARLRRVAPVYRQEMPDGTSYWAVLRHADLVAVAREPRLFSAEVGAVVLEDLPPEQLEQTKNMLLMMDPPRHANLRHNVAPLFKAREIARLEGAIRTVCRTILDRAADQADVEFVHEVAALLPAQVLGEMMGIPQEDRAQIHIWAEMSAGGQDPDVNPDGYATAGPSEGNAQMAIYGMQYAARRRDEEPTDLGSFLLHVEVEGRPMTDLEFGYFFVQLVTAGNDTTRTMLSSGLQALLEHPDELARLRADRELIPSAVEEILRYANPLHYFRRTATADAVVGGQAIAAGDKLAMMYTSANRDETVFTEPDRFDVSRHPNPHLSFGIAEHFCLGVHLARLEARIFFEELLDRFPVIELTGAPRRMRSNLNNALKALPVRLSS
jgi:cytochrome P450